LTELGYDPLFAANGEECAKLYKEKGGDIDLVILDMIIPKMESRILLKNLIKRENYLKRLVRYYYKKGDYNHSLLFPFSVDCFHRSVSDSTEFLIAIRTL
jgi:DNA-binding NtrC family response regulator